MQQPGLLRIQKKRNEKQPLPELFGKLKQSAGMNRSLLLL
jgi:hypothetical protein